MGVVAGMQYDWTRERVDQAVALWRAGSSASEVARKLGGGVSRNAVLGKLLRMGELRRSEQKAAEPRYTRPIGSNQYGDAKPAAPDDLRPRVGPRQIALAGRVKAERRIARERPKPAQQIDGGKTIAQLKYGQCKWPREMSASVLATAQTLFCAAPVRDETCPYCALHARRAFTGSVSQLKPMRPDDRRRFNGRHFRKAS